MDANSWILIAVGALIALCILPMFFMRRRSGRVDRLENEPERFEANKPDGWRKREGRSSKE